MEDCLNTLTFLPSQIFKQPATNMLKKIGSFLFIQINMAYKVTSSNRITHYKNQVPGHVLN
jgi:hypothetical protein